MKLEDHKGVRILQAARLVLDAVRNTHGSSELYRLQFSHDRRFLTPLGRAMDTGHPEMEDLLCRNGARADGNGTLSQPARTGF